MADTLDTDFWMAFEELCRTCYIVLMQNTSLKVFLLTELLTPDELEDDDRRNASSSD